MDVSSLVSVVSLTFWNDSMHLLCHFFHSEDPPTPAPILYSSPDIWHLPCWPNWKHSYKTDLKHQNARGNWVQAFLFEASSSTLFLLFPYAGCAGHLGLELRETAYKSSWQQITLMSGTKHKGKDRRLQAALVGLSGASSLREKIAQQVIQLGKRKEVSLSLGNLLSRDERMSRNELCRKTNRFEGRRKTWKKSVSRKTQRKSVLSN